MPVLLRLLRLMAVLYNKCLQWAAASLCFLRFFCASEITVPTVSAFNETVHLSWSDVSVSKDGRTLRVLLKCTKTDQLMRGTKVYVGTTTNDLCTVTAI